MSGQSHETDVGDARRPRLNAERIIAAGLELSQVPHASSVSVRELGAHLGADPTAIYRHFRNKDDLMRALLDALITRSVASVTATAWQDRLRQLAANTLHQIETHPAIGVEAVVLTTQGPGELDAIELMLGAFSAAGLDDSQIVHHYALFSSHVLSSAAGIARARAEDDIDPGSPGHWFEGTLMVNSRQHPHIARLATTLSELEDKDLFTLGVEAVIQSAEGLVKANSPSRKATPQIQPRRGED